ncbi:MAG: AI-2E family transporter [Deltaproteobacteria bacterium]|nr:AI-2E family transporter [Deltaproteobacteria bacterium]
MNQNWLVTVFFFVLLLVILYLAYLIFSPFLEAVAWAAILAMIVYPVYKWLLRLLKGRATLAALILTVLIIFVIVVPAMRISFFLTEETVELAKAMRSSVGNNELAAWTGHPWVQRIINAWDSVSAELEFFDIDIRQSAAQGAQVASAFLASQVKDVAQNIFLFTINFVIALFTLFFMLRDGQALVDRIHALLPMDQQHKDHLFQNIVNALFAVIHGALITAMIQGMLAGLGYWFLEVPFYIVLAVTTAFTALFPIGGSLLVWLPTSIYLGFIQGPFWKGVALFLWGWLIVGSIDNFLKPLLIGNRLRLPILILFFSILGGLKLFGIIGLILGPMIVALLFALLDLYMKEYVKA